MSWLALTMSRSSQAVILTLSFVIFDKILWFLLSILPQDLTISSPKIRRISKKEKMVTTKSHQKRSPTPKKEVAKIREAIQRNQRRIVQMIPRNIGRRVGLDLFDRTTTTTVVETVVAVAVLISVNQWQQLAYYSSLRTY